MSLCAKIARVQEKYDWIERHVVTREGFIAYVTMTLSSRDGPEQTFSIMKRAVWHSLLTMFTELVSLCSRNTST
jgi:hypothetical protein